MPSHVRVLARYVKVFNRRLRQAVRYHRGDTIPVDDLEPGVLAHLLATFGPRDGSKALGRLLDEHGAHWEARDKDGRKDWQEPDWFKSQIIPAVEFVHHHKQPRDAHGRFEKE